MRLNNWRCLVRRARNFAALGFGSSTASRLIISRRARTGCARQHAGVGASARGSIRHFKRASWRYVGVPRRFAFVAQLPLGSEIFGVAAYGADFCLPTNFPSYIVLVEPGSSQCKARIFCCSDHRSPVAPPAAWAWAADVVRRGYGGFRAKPCTDGWDFISTDCQLTWKGIAVYGTIDAGFGWQSTARRGTTIRCRSLILNPETETGRRLEPCTQRLDQSFMESKELSRAAGTSLCLCPGRWLHPYSLRFSNGPGSVARTPASPKPGNRLLRFKPSGRGSMARLCRRQFSDLWHPDGFRQNSLTWTRLRLRSVRRLYAFSPIGFSGNNLRRRQYRKL